MQTQKPVKPLPQWPSMEQVMEAARATNATQGFPLAGLGRSAFTAVPPTTPLYPEFALFSQFNQLFPQAAQGAIDPNVLSLLGQQQQQQNQAQTGSNRGGGRSKSGDSKTSSAYASRHQAAEQRRRTRINERLDRLRTVVPHAERANTATFLEEVINYIGKLTARIKELESAANVPASDRLVVPDQGASQSVPGEVKSETAKASAATIVTSTTPTVSAPALSATVPGAAPMPALAQEPSVVNPAEQGQQPAAEPMLPQIPVAEPFRLHLHHESMSTVPAAAADHTQVAGAFAAAAAGSAVAQVNDDGVPVKKRKMSEEA